MRDITLEDTFQQQFTTRAFATGIPGTLGGTPVLSVKESGNATPITAGVSVSVDVASVTGLNEATIVATAANGYETGKTYALYISTGTVDSVSVIGEVVGEFTIGASAARIYDGAIEDHVAQGTPGYVVALSAYAGSDGPGIYVDSNAANTNTVLGTDGTEKNPVSTFVASRTLADALGVNKYYLEGNSDSTLAAIHEDWEFIGIGSVANNVVNLGSQDVDRSLFRNLTLEGTQGGTGRITARDCALQDPGAGTTIFHIFAERCGIVDDILVDTSADNVFDSCFSLAASGVAPIITATGASGSILISHFGGRIELKSLSASHNIELDGHGHVIFNADCNVNANVEVHGIWDVTDNTAGMSDLATEVGLVNMTKINTEADTALSDYDGPTKGEMDTAHALLATPADVLAQVIQGLKDVGLVLHHATIETVTDQTNFIIPATDDAPDDNAYNDCLAIVIDGTDPNQIGIGRVQDYDTGTRNVVLKTAMPFTVTSSDTLIILGASLGDFLDAGGGEFIRSTDSLQVIRDRGDAAWTTGSGGQYYRHNQHHPYHPDHRPCRHGYRTDRAYAHKLPGRPAL